VATLRLGMSESACGGASSGNTSDGKEFSCDYCGESYDTQQALNSHRGQKHPDKARVTFECAYCCSDISVIRSDAENYDNHFCDRECKGNYRSESDDWNGENHPRYNSSEVVCDNCGSKLVRPQRRLDRYNLQCCDSDCYGEYMSQTGMNDGEDNPAYNSVVIECDWCGEDFTTPVSVAENGRRFCDKSCWADFMSDYLSGEGSPLYTGYYAQTYGDNWDDIRNQVRGRDQYTCQACGVSENSLSRELDVHHIVPLKHFDTPETANDLDNLVSLCSSCHSKWEGLYLRPDSR